jgi:hypothetical protein
MRDLTLVQPSARRREWEIRDGQEVRARLRLPMFRSGGLVQVRDERWRIERNGVVRPDYVLRDEPSGAEIARVRRDGRRRRLELEGQVAEWRKLGRGKGFGFVGEDGEPLVSGQVRSGFARSSGALAVDPRIAERDALAAAVLACFLLIRRNEEQAAAATAAANS